MFASSLDIPISRYVILVFSSKVTKNFPSRNCRQNSPISSSDSIISPNLILVGCSCCEYLDRPESAIFFLCTSFYLPSHNPLFQLLAPNAQPILCSHVFSTVTLLYSTPVCPLSDTFTSLPVASKYLILSSYNRFARSDVVPPL